MIISKCGGITGNKKVVKFLPPFESGIIDKYIARKEVEESLARHEWLCIARLQ